MTIPSLTALLAQQQGPKNLLELFGGPWITDPKWVLVTILMAYFVTLAGSGPIIRYLVVPPSSAKGNTSASKVPKARFDPSVVIGKCENIITITLVLLNQFSGLAIIFAGKSLVRKEQIEENPGFFLGGTLVNLVWGLMVGIALRILVLGN